MLSIPKPLKTVVNLISTATTLGVVGFKDRRGLNPALFIEIHVIPALNSDVKVPLDMATTSVRGRLISDDDSTNVSWESPLEGSSLESRFSGVLALLKSGLIDKYTGVTTLAGRTLTNKTETLQIFKGIESQEKTFMLEFVAFNDAVSEVEAPFNLLRKMASPQLTDGLIDAMINEGKARVEDLDKEGTEKYTGESPFDVVVSVGGRRLKNRWVIQSVSSDRDSIKVDRNGNTIYRQVNLVIKSKQAIMRDDISIVRG